MLTTLDRQLDDLRAAVATVPEDSRERRPTPDRWSVAEVLEHLAIVEAMIMKLCARQLAAAREAGLAEEIETSSIITLLPPERVANRKRAITAPETLRPRGMDVQAAWAELEQIRGRFRQLVESCDGLALGDVSFPHPVLGSLNVYQWFLFASGHQARHAAQIREIADQLRR